MEHIHVQNGQNIKNGKKGAYNQMVWFLTIDLAKCYFQMLVSTISEHAHMQRLF